MTSEIIYLPAIEIANKILSFEISVVEVATAFLNQIELHNKRINAITDIRNKEDILKEAQEKDQLLKKGIILGKMHGLPITVKDGYNVKGLISCNGVPNLKNNIAKDDAELIKRLKAAGAIIIGKTNLPLFSLDWQTTNSWFGQTNNPYDISRVPGGSSGGSSAALAMGFTPLELGSDYGGSIRIPSHFCGICGLRPTEHALPNRGQFVMPGKPQGHRMITVSGPMARNVGDLIYMMEVLLKTDKQLAEITPIDFNSGKWQKGKLKIAYSSTLNNVEVDKEYSDLLYQFVKKLEENGHQIIHDTPIIDEKLAYSVWAKVYGHEVDASSPAPTFLTKPFMFFFILFKYRDLAWAKNVFKGIGISAENYATMLNDKDKISDIFSDFLTEYDIWLSPVASFAAFHHQKAGKAFIVNGKKVPYTKAMGGFNNTTALSGHPVVVIPIGQTSKGLPLGIQIHAKKWTDRKLLEIAQYLETLTRGFQKPN